MRAEPAGQQPALKTGRRGDFEKQADISIGQRLRLRRTLLGISQEQLANALGISFQQIQKYESGANRLGGSRIWRLSQVLEVSPSYFFDDLALDSAAAADRGVNASRFMLELSRAIASIPDDRIRQRILELSKALAGGAEKSQ